MATSIITIIFNYTVLQASHKLHISSPLLLLLAWDSCFQSIPLNLHCGTTTFSKRCLLDTYFLNSSENPVFIILRIHYDCFDKLI